MKLAIKKHWGDVVAIVALVVLSVVVAGYILSKERFHFPLIQSTPFEVNAEFSTAQAVMPGQGQSVRVSGVQIGDIGGVSLKDGRAIVQLRISDSYRHLIHTDATALLRPRTGLKDMFVEVDPGSKTAPVVSPGFTIPVSNTSPDVNLDEILSSLDSDTRAYLTLLVNGAGQGLKGNGGNELAQVLERFEPTHRDLARVSTAIAAEGDPSTAPDQLAAASQHRARGQAGPESRSSSTRAPPCSGRSRPRIATSARAIAELPGTLRQTTATLGKVQAFADAARAGRPPTCCPPRGRCRPPTRR